MRTRDAAGGRWATRCALPQVPLQAHAKRRSGQMGLEMSCLPTVEKGLGLCLWVGVAGVSWLSGGGHGPQLASRSESSEPLAARAHPWPQSRLRTDLWVLKHGHTSVDPLCGPLWLEGHQLKMNPERKDRAHAGRFVFRGADWAAEPWCWHSLGHWAREPKSSPVL